MRRRELGGAGNEHQALLAAGNLEADIGLGLGGERGSIAFEIERRLARHQEQLGLEAARQREPLAGADRPARDHVGREHAEDRIGGEDAERRLGRVESERPALAQRQQARGLVDLGAGEHDRRDRAVAQARAAAARAWLNICWRRSGEALTSTNAASGASGSSAVTARLACVRGFTRGRRPRRAGTPDIRNSTAGSRPRPQRPV